MSLTYRECEEEMAQFLNSKTQGLHLFSSDSQRDENQILENDQVWIKDMITLPWTVCECNQANISQVLNRSVQFLEKTLLCFGEDFHGLVQGYLSIEENCSSVTMHVIVKFV